MVIAQSLLGIVVFIFIAWLLSENRRDFPVRVVAAGVLLQWGLAFCLLELSFFNQLFLLLNEGLLALEQATQDGTRFVFGYLGGAELPFDEPYPGASFILAFRALPLILVISALSALLFYWRMLPWVVKGFAWVLNKVMGIGGSVGLGAAANIFVGMTEAPLLIKPYLERMTRGELFALMVTGMATIAGTMMVLYASILSTLNSEVMGHILTASVISVPAALLFAAVMVPHQADVTVLDFDVPQTASSAMDAVTQGTLQGVKLLLNIIAMLIVLIALVSLVNMLLALLPDIQGEPISLQRLLGFLLAPLVWLMGIPWAEAQYAGSLMGIKTVLNEFLAYMDLAQQGVKELTERSQLIMIYALCGFANFGSLGIMLGGLSTLVPERRAEIAALGLKSIVAGTLATMMTGAVVSVLL